MVSFCSTLSSCALALAGAGLFRLAGPGRLFEEAWGFALGRVHGPTAVGRSSPAVDQAPDKGFGGASGRVVVGKGRAAPGRGSRPPAVPCVVDALGGGQGVAFEERDHAAS